MGPPAKGTVKYTLYLKQQKLRRRTARKATKNKKLKQALDKHVVKEKTAIAKKYQDHIAEVTARSNKHMRHAAAAAADSKKYKHERDQIKHQFAEMTKKAEYFEEMYRSEQAKHKETSTARNKAMRTVSYWDVWFRNLKDRAPAALMQKVAKFGRPRSAPADRCWGGGQ